MLPSLSQPPSTVPGALKGQGEHHRMLAEAQAEAGSLWGTQQAPGTTPAPQAL